MQEVLPTRLATRRDIAFPFSVCGPEFKMQQLQQLTDHFSGCKAAIDDSMLLRKGPGHETKVFLPLESLGLYLQMKNLEVAIFFEALSFLSCLSYARFLDSQAFLVSHVFSLQRTS